MTDGFGKALRLIAHLHQRVLRLKPHALGGCRRPPWWCALPGAQKPSPGGAQVQVPLIARDPGGPQLDNFAGMLRGDSGEAVSIHAAGGNAQNHTHPVQPAVRYTSRTASPCLRHVVAANTLYSPARSGAHLCTTAENSAYARRQRQ